MQFMSWLRRKSSGLLVGLRTRVREKRDRRLATDRCVMMEPLESRLLLASTAVLTPIVVKDTAAHGIETGVVYAGFSTPVVDDVGRVYFVASLADALGNPVGNPQGAWVADQAVVSPFLRVGDIAPGTGVLYGGLISLNAAGDGWIAVDALLAGDPDSNQALFRGRVGPASSALSLVMRVGDTPAGAEDAFTTPLTPLLNAGGQVGFSNNAPGFVEGSGWINQTLVNRTGDAAPGNVPQGSVYVGTGGIEFLNDSGSAAFIQTASPAQFTVFAGVWSGDPSNLSLGPVFSSQSTPFGGPAAPPLTAAPGISNAVLRQNGFDLLSYNNAGQIVITSTVLQQINETTSVSRRGLFTGSTSGLELIAIEHGPTGVPGTEFADPTNPANATQFMGFTNVLMDGQANVAFRSEISGSGVTAANANGIFYGSGGELSVVARDGDAAPNVHGFPNATFNGVGTPIAINSNGQLVFQSGIRLGQFQSADSLWLYDDITGERTMLLRRLQAVDINGVARFVDTWTVDGGNGEDGTATAFTDEGLLALRVNFTGLEPNNSAIISVHIEPKPEASNTYIWDGLLDNQWWRDDGEVTNWIDDQGVRHVDPPGDSISDHVIINGANVVLSRAGGQATIVGTIDADGSLAVSTPLTVDDDSNFDTLTINSAVDLSGVTVVIGDVLDLVSGTLTTADTMMQLHDGSIVVHGGTWQLGAGTQVTRSSGDGTVSLFGGETIKSDNTAATISAPLWINTLAPDNGVLRVTAGQLQAIGGGNWVVSSNTFPQQPHIAVDTGASVVLGGSYNIRGHVLIQGSGDLSLVDAGVLSTTSAATDSIDIRMVGSGAFSFEGGRIAGPAEVSVLGNMQWSGGEIAAGSLDDDNNPQGGLIVNVPEFRIADGGVKAITGVLVNEGVIRQTSDVALNGGSIVNTGTYDLQKGTIATNGVGRIVNANIFTKTLLPDDAAIVEANYVQKSGGTTRAAVGTLSLRGFTEFLGGTVQPASQATVAFRGNSVVIRNPVTMNGTGIVELEVDSTLTIVASATLTTDISETADVETLSGLVIDGGHVQVEGAWRNDGRVLWRRGDINVLTSASAVNNGEFETIDDFGKRLGGTLKNTGVITLGASVGKRDDATLLVNEGAVIFDQPSGATVAFTPKFDNRDHVAVDEGTHARLDGPVEQFTFLGGLARLEGGHWRVSNGGSLRIEPKTPIPDELTVINLVQHGTTVILQGTGTMNGLPFKQDHAAAFHNQGTVVLEQGVQWNGGPLLQNGVLRVDGTSQIFIDTPVVFLPDAYEFGVVVFRADLNSKTTIDGALIVVDLGGPFENMARIDFRPGSELNGTGHINGRAIVSGTVKPGKSPGTLTLEGDWTFTDTAILELEAAGIGAGASDVLNVDGDITFAGEVRYAFVDGFAPQAGDQWPFITVTGELSGTFDSSRVVGLADGFAFDAAFDESGQLTLLALTDGLALPASVVGVRFTDLNGDGDHDNDEPGLAGVVVTLTGDVDGDGDEESIEATTDSQGRYTFTDLHPGTYVITAPDPATGLATTAFTVTVEAQSGEVVVGSVGLANLANDTAEVEVVESLLGFGSAEFDFGDAPDPPYRTLLSADGARHTVGSGLSLGTVITPENEAITNAIADADTGDDGVTLVPMLLGRAVNVGVDVTLPTGMISAVVDGWIDWNQDGDWDDEGEHAVVGAVVADGANTLQVTAPDDALVGSTFARFRLTTDGIASPIGVGGAGEVEDYVVSVSAATPVGSVGGDSGNSKLSVADTHGNTFTFSLSGPGEAMIFAEGDGRLSVEVIHSTNASKLTITASGSGDRALRSITVTAGDIASITGKAINMRGDVLIEGSLTAMTLGDLRDGQTLSIAGSSTDTPAKVTLGRVADLTFVSSVPLASLTATEWLDLTAADDRLAAPWIVTLAIKGDKRQSVTGDFEAAVELEGSDAPANVVMKSVKIAGVVGGAWNIAGNIGVVAGGGSTGDWAVLVTGDWQTLSLKGDASGNLQAASLGSAAIKGAVSNLRLELVGDVDALLLKSLKITGIADELHVRATGSLGAITAPAMRHSSILAGIDDGAEGLPTAAVTFVNASAIQAVTVKGIKGEPASFVDTILAASSLTKATIAFPETDNDGVEFGVAVQSLGSIALQTEAGKQKVTQATLEAGFNHIGNFHLRLVPLD